MAQLYAPSDWRLGGSGFNPRWGRQHSFVEIDHEIFSTVILSLQLIQEGQLSVSGERMCTILVNCLEDYACPVNVWLGKLTALDMTPLGWLGRKTSTQTNKVGMIRSYWVWVIGGKYSISQFYRLIWKFLCTMQQYLLIKEKQAIISFLQVFNFQCLLAQYYKNSIMSDSCLCLLWK